MQGKSYAGIHFAAAEPIRGPGSLERLATQPEEESFDLPDGALAAAVGAPSKPDTTRVENENKVFRDYTNSKLNLLCIILYCIAVGI